MLCLHHADFKKYEVLSWSLRELADLDTVLGGYIGLQQSEQPLSAASRSRPFIAPFAALEEILRTDSGIGRMMHLDLLATRVVHSIADSSNTNAFTPKKAGLFRRQGGLGFPATHKVKFPPVAPVSMATISATREISTTSFASGWPWNSCAAHFDFRLMLHLTSA